MLRIRVRTNACVQISLNNMQEKKLKLITFDLDHTLWNPDAALQRAELASYQWLAAQQPAFAAAFSLADFLLCAYRFASSILSCTIA